MLGVLRPVAGRLPLDKGGVFQELVLSARGKIGILFVRKKTGMIRMVLDCRYTNGLH